MADELKSERVQLLMGPSELKSIDDWSFKNRIRTRAEAIRRLCQIGLSTDAADVRRISLGTLEALKRAATGIHEQFGRRSEKEPKAVSEIRSAFQEFYELYLEFAHHSLGIESASGKEDIKRAIEEAQIFRDKLGEFRAKDRRKHNEDPEVAN